MSSSHDVEWKAVKFLQKLIQDSKDELAKLATKLYVILQHMKFSGKEHSTPLQVILKVMETVINRHGIDLDALKSLRLPLADGSQTMDSTSGHIHFHPTELAQNEMPKFDPYSSSGPPVGPSIVGHEYYQGAGTHRSSKNTACMK